MVKNPLICPRFLIQIRFQYFWCRKEPKPYGICAVTKTLRKKQLNRSKILILQPRNKSIRPRHESQSTYIQDVVFYYFLHRPPPCLSPSESALGLYSKQMQMHTPCLTNNNNNNKKKVFMYTYFVFCCNIDIFNICQFHQ